MSRRAWGGARLALAGTVALVAGCGSDDDDEAHVAGPRVTEIEPVGRVDRTVPIVVGFSHDAPEALVGRPRPIEAVAVLHPELPAVATFVDRRTLRIVPAAPFASATRYRLALRPDVLGESAPLRGRRAFRFHTPAFGLDAARGWRSESGLTVSVRFSHPVGLAAAEAALSVWGPDGALLPARIRTGDGEDLAPTALRLPLEVQLAKGEVPERVRLRVDPGLAPSEGGEPLGKRIRRWVTVEPEAPVVDQVRPVQLGARWGVAIDLGAEVAPSRLVGAVRGAGPSVRMALAPGGPWILGAFSPETTASLQIGPPLLPSPRPWVVELPPLRPAIRITDPEPLLDLAPGARLEVEHHGVERLVLTARAVGPELVGLVGDGLVPARPLPEAWSGPTLGPIVRSAELSGKTSLDPGPLLDGLSPSLVLLEVRDEQRPWLADARYLNRRGLELVVKRRSGYLWARVEDVRGPVERASVEVLGGGGEVLASGATNADGAVELRYSGGAGVLAAARDGERYAVLPLSGPFALRGVDRPGLRATLVPDRAVLAPGQELELSVLLADARERPVGGTLEARLRRERGPVVAESEVRVAARGTGRARLRLPSEAEPGRHRLALSEPGGGRLVEVPVEVRLRRDGGARVVVDAEPEPLAFRVRAEGLVRTAALHGVCRYQRLDTFAGLPPPPAPPPAVEPVTVDLGDGQARVVRCPPPPTGTRPWAVRLEGFTREARSGMATQVYAPEPRYAALELSDEPPMAGEPLDARLRVVDARGRPVEGAVEVEIRALEPRSGARVRPGGRLVPEILSVAGEPRTLTLALVEGAAVVPFVPPRGGPWSLRVGDTETRIWVGGAPGTPRPLELVLHRTGNGVRAALPFPGRLLLAEEGLEVGGTRASLETSVVAEHRLERPAGAALTGLLLGAEGRWSAARLPPLDTAPRWAEVDVEAPTRIEPGADVEVRVRVQGPAWSGVFRVLLVDAAAAPTRADLERWLDEEADSSALDTLVTAAFDDPVRARTPSANGKSPTVDVGRPGRAAVASAWLPLSSQGYGVTRLRLPDVAGRVRIVALVRAGGRLGFGTLERVIGDGLGLDAVVPPALRAGDRLLVPVLLDNGAGRPMSVTVEIEGEGFAALGGATRVELGPGRAGEVRLPAEARAEGALEIRAGEARLSRAVRRIEDARRRWLGRGATASYRSSAVLPTPEQLGSQDAFLAVGPLALTRFAAALQGLLDAPVVDAEGAAAVVLAARAVPDLTRALGGEAAVETALPWLETGMSASDPWLRVFSAHAAVEAGAGLQTAARRVLAEVASSPSAPNAAPYARLLLARLGQGVPAPADRAPSSRPDAVAMSAVAEILLDRAQRDLLDSLPIAPFTGARVGRFSPTLVDALTLFALESLPGSHPAAALLEAAMTGSARMSRWSHLAEEALALVALAARAERTPRRSYWGSVLLDGETVARFNAQRVLVLPLGDRLGARPEVTVTGAGAAEVGLVLAGDPNAPAPPGNLDLSARRVDELGAPLDRPVPEGRPLALAIEVRNAANAAEAVRVDVPIPAGVSVESSPPGAEPTPGGWALVTEVPGKGTWTGRFELRARHAGVWGAPPVTASLRHDLAEARVPQEELRIDPVEARLEGPGSR